MPTIKIADDILSPKNKIRISYKGKNSFFPVTIIPTMLKDILRISGKDLFAKDLRWDATADAKQCYCVWYAKYEEDRWTDIMFKVTLQGAQNSSDKMGWINIDLEGKVTTEFEYSNFLQKALWFIFNRMFYYKQRRMYMEEGKEYIYKFREELLHAMKLEGKLDVEEPEQATT